MLEVFFDYLEDQILKLRFGKYNYKNHAQMIFLDALKGKLPLWLVEYPLTIPNFSNCPYKYY